MLTQVIDPGPRASIVEVVAPATRPMVAGYEIDETGLMIGAGKPVDNSQIMATPALTRPGEKPSCDDLIGGIGLLVMGLIAWLLIPHYLPHKPSSQLAVCKSNCLNLAAMLELYAAENGGDYPGSLAEVTPRYLENLPTCPTAGKPTYTDYEACSLPHRFTFHCCGGYHRSNYPPLTKETFYLPGYSSEKGLLY